MKINKIAIAVFVITLMVTLSTDLLIGVGTGILLEIFINIYFVLFMYYMSVSLYSSDVLSSGFAFFILLSECVYIILTHTHQTIIYIFLECVFAQKPPFFL